jgi:hypothetical protein
MYNFGANNGYPGAGLNGLIIDSSGNLYGTTSNTVFELAADHATFTTLVTFTGSASFPGNAPQGLTLDASGNIFGTTEVGGTQYSGQAIGGNGTIFEISADHKTFTSLVSFTGTTGNYQGAYPYGGLTIDSNGNLYGTTGWTGSSPSRSLGDGTIFKLAADHTTFTTLYYFSSTSRPTGTMAIDGSGNLYGTTQDVQTFGNGSIFEFSATQGFHTLFSFNTAQTAPAGNLAIDSAGDLFGATDYRGTIFELAADHTTFTPLVTTNATSTLGNPGTIIDSAGNVYVTTSTGGSYTQGNITEIAADGTNNLVANSGVTTIGNPPGVQPVPAESFTSITVGAGATVAVSPNSTGHTVVTTGTLSLAGSTSAWTGNLNLATNDLDLISGSLAAITNQIQHAYAGGSWTGQGIGSTSAAQDSTHLTALGVIQNNQSGTALFTASNTFDGTVPGASDVLVKYTYYGDANLDGKVDGSDYSRIDNGYLDHLTSWFNGDFNYDGIINGSDYTLIDNSFDTQGASLAARESSAVQLASAATPRAVSVFATTPIGTSQNAGGISIASVADQIFASPQMI